MMSRRRISAAARKKARQAERDRYEELKALDICPVCGCEDARPGRVLGDECARKRTAAYANYRRQKLALPDPPCRDCLSRPRRPGLTQCQPCADRYAAYQRDRRLWEKVA